MPVEVVTGAFDPAAKQQAFEQTLTPGTFGATANFIGTMRTVNEGDEVVGMYLEHYPGMTETELEKIIADAAQQWRIIDALIVHRVGELEPGEPIVLTTVWSKHRKDAFEAVRYLMEALKSRAPFWKKETLATGETRWVEKNTPGY
jgi:molybdopterin synthase catalytic subunit